MTEDAWTKAYRARGYHEKKWEQTRKVAVMFRDDQMVMINRLAVLHRVSFAEIVRRLIDRPAIPQFLLDEKELEKAKQTAMKEYLGREQAAAISAPV